MTLEQMQNNVRQDIINQLPIEAEGYLSKEFTDSVVAATWKAALNSILESGLLEEKDYVYEDENKEHNEFESTLEHHETMGEAHHSGHNTLARANKEFISNMDKE